MSKFLHLSSKHYRSSIIDNYNNIQKIYSKFNDVYFNQLDTNAQPSINTRNGIVFDNAGGASDVYLISNYNSNFNLSSNDFHIEFWVRIEESYGYNELISRVNSGTTSYKLMYIDEISGWQSDSLTLAISTNGTTWDQKIVADNISNYLKFKRWNHIAVFRNYDVINFTVNGFLVKRANISSSLTVYSNNDGIQIGKYDTDEYINNPTKPRGKILSDTSTSGGGSYQVNGDPFPDYATYGNIEPVTQYEDDNEQIIWFGYFYSAFYEYNVTTNTGTLFSNITTSSGGTHQVNGDPLPNSRIKSFAYNHLTKKLYVGQRYSLWEYDYVTNTGTIIGYSWHSTADWRDLYIESGNNVLYGGVYNWGAPKYINLNDSGYTINTVNVSSGDNHPGGSSNQVAFSPTGAKIATTTTGLVPDVLWLYDISTENGKNLSPTNTGGGGSYEVSGDAAPNSDAEKCAWYVDVSGNSILVVGYWGGGIWLYDEQNSTGKLLTTTSTDVGGNYEVNGYPLPDNTIRDLTQIDNIIYVGTNSGMWEYNPITNSGKTYTVVSTSTGGDYEVNGDALTNDLNKDSYTDYIAKFGNTIYKPIDGTSTVWIYKEFSASYLNGYIDELIMYNGITGSTPYNSLGYDTDDKIFEPTLRNLSPSNMKQVLPNNMLKYIIVGLSSKSIRLNDSSGYIIDWYNLVNGNDFSQTGLTNMPILDINEGISFVADNDNFFDGGSGSTYDFGTGTFHLECWAKYSTCSIDGTILSISNGSTFPKEFNLGFHNYTPLPYNSLRIVHSNSSGSSYNNTELDLPMSANTWYHIAYGRDLFNNEYTIIDGILRKKVENSTFMLDGTDTLIGKWKRLPETARRLDGNLDNFNLYSVNLYDVSTKNEGDRIFTQLPPRQSKKVNDFESFELVVTVSSGDTLTIPMLDGIYAYNYTIDWGDETTINTVTSYNDVNATHTYDSGGTFNIRIAGTCESFYVNNGDMKNYLTQVLSWGNSNIKNVNFYGCSLLTSVPSTLTTLTATNMSQCFYGCSSLNCDMSGWDVSNVTNFYQFFYGCSVFNGNVTTWDVSNALTLGRMFTNCSAFNQDIGSWNVSSNTNFQYFLAGCSSFNYSLDSWDVSSVTIFDYMFQNAILFNQDLNSWILKNSGAITLQYMFYGAIAFNGNITSWNTNYVTSFYNMFNGASAFNQDIGNWVTNNVINMGRMFWDATSFNQDLGNWNTGSVISMQYMFTNSLFNYDISLWDVFNVSDFTSMFQNTPFDQDISGWIIKNTGTVNMNAMFRLTPFNQDISGWDVSAVTNMYYMFASNSAFNIDISSWNVGNVVNFGRMFYQSYSFNQDLSSWDVSSATNMDLMFEYIALNTTYYTNMLIAWAALPVQSGVTFSGGNSKYYTSAQSSRDILTNPLGYNWTITDGGVESTPVSEPEYLTLTLNVNNDTITIPHLDGYNYDYWIDWGDGNDSTVTSYNDPNTSHTYSYTGTVDIRISGTCETLYVDFSDGSNLPTTLTEIKSWGNAGQLRQLRLYQCALLTSFPTGSTEQGKLHNMETFYYSFGQCDSLVSIPEGMFNGCTGVTTNAFYATFFGCGNLTTIPAGLFDDCINATVNGFCATFQGCALTSIPNNLFDNNVNVTSYGFRAAFAGCNITSIPTDLFRYNTGVTSHAFDSTFKDCVLLETVPQYLFRYNTLATSWEFYQTFRNCPKLQLNQWIFYADGEQSTRFLNTSPSFHTTFYRDTFTGIQGTAPDLWNCDYGTGTPVTTSTFGGAGNSLTSLSNYGSIPGGWL